MLTGQSQDFGTTLWKLDEMSEPIVLPINYVFFVNAFIVEGRHLVIFCNQYLLTCTLDNIHELKQNALEILKNYYPDEEEEQK